MKNKLLFIAFIEGAFVMILELVGVRFIAPYFGASIITWTIILSVVVTSLALGYYLGGKLSKKKELEKLLLSIFAIICVFISLIPFISGFLGSLMNNHPIYLSISILSTSILLIPNILFGAISPIIIEKINRLFNNEVVGINAGKVYAISTIGGILTTYIFGFFIIPSFGLVKPLILFTLFSYTIIFIFIFGKSYFNIKYFIPYAAFIITLIFTKSSGKDVKYYSEGLLGQIVVADVPNDFTKKEDRILFVNRMGQTWVDKNSKQSMWNYPHYISSITSVFPENSKVLLLGLGGGTIANDLKFKLGFDLDVVELDSRISKVAKKYFGYNSKKTKIDDARHYLENTGKKYDLIIFDVFKGEVAPSYVLTKESFDRVKEILKPNGMMLINFNGFVNGKEGVPTRSVYATLIKSGYIVNVIPTDGKESERNNLFIASIKELDFKNPRFKLYLKNIPHTPNDLFVSNSEYIKDNKYVLTDNKPNLEILNIYASQSWRKDYKENFKDKLPDNKVPKFW